MGRGLARVRVYDAPCGPDGRAELRWHGTVPAALAEDLCAILRAGAARYDVGYTQSGRARHVDD